MVRLEISISLHEAASSICSRELIACVCVLQESNAICVLQWCLQERLWAGPGPLRVRADGYVATAGVQRVAAVPLDSLHSAALAVSEVNGG